MITIYDGQLVGTQALPFKFPLTDSKVLYINIYNMTPFRLYFSLSLGLQDVFLPPNYTIEGLYLGKQGGANLSVGEDTSYVQQIQLTKITAAPNQSTQAGQLSILGFYKDENWQGKKPLIAGGLAVSTSVTIANELINTTAPAGAPVINIANTTTPFTGFVMDNAGDVQAGVISNGASANFLFSQPGTASTPASMQFGANIPTCQLQGHLNTNQQMDTGDNNGGSNYLWQPQITSGNTSNIIVAAIDDNNASAVTWWVQKLSHGNGDSIEFLDNTHSANCFVIQPNSLGCKVPKPDAMSAGFQETGDVGFIGKAVTAADIWGYRVNFKTLMTNTPSSITLNSTVATNCTAAASNIDKQGFTVKFTATAAGVFDWEGTYTTVGN